MHHHIRILLNILILTTFSFQAAGQEQTKVMLMEIKSEIDPRTNRYTELAIDHAEEIEADIVIIEMDTYGGVVTDAKDIVEKIMDFDRPVWVFINKDAASAGALISIACDSIYMAPGANIGAATVVYGDGQAAPDKYQSYMRSTMRSIAEENGRDPRIAEGMVDETIAIDSVTKEGNVITFSTKEAIQYGFCEAKVSSVEEILERNGIEDYELVTYELGASEKIISFFLNPFLSGILIMVIVGGIWFELQTPGVGFPIGAAIIALILYFVPYYMNGLAENWEIIAFFVGVVLIGLELFVIPGFGIAGIAGITLVIGSLILVMLNNDAFDFTFVGVDDIMIAAIVASIGIFGGVALLFIVGVRFTESKFFARVALTETMSSEAGYTSSFNAPSLKGKTGVAHTILRPSGKIMIEGNLYDAYTRGDYIEKDVEITVISDEGTSLKVKRA